MSATPLLQKVDAVTVPVPNLDTGLRFGHQLRWRNDQIGQADLGMPGSDTEIVLTTRQEYEPNWLVTSAGEAAAAVLAAGGRISDRSLRHPRRPRCCRRGWPGRQLTWPGATMLDNGLRPVEPGGASCMEC